MIRRLAVLAAVLLTTACASGPTTRELIQLTYYRITGQVLVVCPTAEGLSFVWAREKDAAKRAEQCRADARKKATTPAKNAAKV